MSDLTQTGQAIEGDAVEGQSRHPLKARGLAIHNGVRCFRFVASFDVKARIAKALSAGSTRLEPTASTSLSDEVICDKAVIHSLKQRHSSSVSKGSATHQANHWHFPQQSSVRIDMPHQELVNAQSKRLGAGPGESSDNEQE